jgi:hypothetical protein
VNSKGYEVDTPPSFDAYLLLWYGCYSQILHIFGKGKTMLEIIGPITEIETFATASAIRELPRLKKLYGFGRWRKRKGIADVRLPDGAVVIAEIH